MQSLFWTSEVAELARRHARSGFPNEVCGVLVGHDDAQKAMRVITRVVPADNVWDADADRTHRFLLDPRQQMRVEREAEADGLSVLGFYHSHPNAPAVPSAFDLDAAWAAYSYVILAVTAGGVTETRSWVLDESTANERRFLEQHVTEWQP